MLVGVLAAPLENQPLPMPGLSLGDFGWVVSPDYVEPQGLRFPKGIGDQQGRHRSFLTAERPLGAPGPQTTASLELLMGSAWTQLAENSRASP